MAIVNTRAGIVAAVIVGGATVFFALRGKSDAPAAARPDRPVPVVVSTVRKADDKGLHRAEADTIDGLTRTTA